MNSAQQGFRLTKQFAVISFLSITLSAILIFLFFRYETIQTIESTSRDGNEALTIALEYALNDHFIQFIEQASVEKDQPIKRVPIDPALAKALDKMLFNTNVVRVKIYDRHGRVIFSTKESQIGDTQEDNHGFYTAMQGDPSTILIYRDTFNIFDKATEDDNLVQTYVPIRDTFDSPIVGVFEVYSDINRQIDQSYQLTILVWLIITLVMFALFAFLLLVVKRAENIIRTQNQETSERKKMLEFLSAKMINAQEDEKKRIALELHEDVVQTISGVKMQLERYLLTVDKIGDKTDVDLKQITRDIVPILQEAARRIRLVAMDLRPPSLDDFGLIAAINSLISECDTQSPGLEIHTHFTIEEGDISEEEKSILYRMVKEIVSVVCFQEKILGVLHLFIENEGGQLLLRVVIESEQIKSTARGQLPRVFGAMRERTILSGGDFQVVKYVDQRIEVSAGWLS
ncbi:MAG: hypothetical protein C0631_02260 [Sedimenticola sp.]|nr:MAG: hypothetical protein C0631_02260 [Sedimenticola sp.]